MTPRSGWTCARPRTPCAARRWNGPFCGRPTSTRTSTKTSSTPPLVAGELALPAGEVPEPFIDIDDVADAAAAVLTEPGRHAGRIYELTGPRALTFAEAVELISRASGLPITYKQISSAEYTAALVEEGWSEHDANHVTEMFVMMDTRGDRRDDGRRRRRAGPGAPDLRGLRRAGCGGRSVAPMSAATGSLTAEDIVFLGRPLYGFLYLAPGPHPPQPRPVWFEATAEGRSSCSRARTR